MAGNNGNHRQISPTTSTHRRRGLDEVTIPYRKTGLKDKKTQQIRFERVPSSGSFMCSFRIVYIRTNQE